MLQDISILPEERLKIKQSLSNEAGFESVNDSGLPQTSRIEPVQGKIKKETTIKKEKLSEDDEIPAFLSEAKVDEDVFIPAEPSKGSISKTSS